MSLKEALNQYLNKQISAMELIRLLTGIVNPDHAVDTLAIINQVTRLELGDQDVDTFKAIFKL